MLPSSYPLSARGGLLPAQAFLSVEIGFREADPGMSGPRRGPACVENKFFEKI